MTAESWTVAGQVTGSQLPSAKRTIAPRTGTGLPSRKRPIAQRTGTKSPSGTRPHPSLAVGSAGAGEVAPSRQGSPRHAKAAHRAAADCERPDPERRSFWKAARGHNPALLPIKLLPGVRSQPFAGMAENAQKRVATNKDGLKVAMQLDATQRTKIGQSASCLLRFCGFGR